MERSPVAGSLGGVEFLDKSVGAHHIWNSQVPARDVGRTVGADGGNADVLDVPDSASMIGEIGINLQPRGIGGSRGVIHFAVVAKSQSVLEHVVPDETGGGIGQ